jgi:hypothetical protein
LSLRQGFLKTPDCFSFFLFSIRSYACLKTPKFFYFFPPSAGGASWGQKGRARVRVEWSSDWTVTYSQKKPGGGFIIITFEGEYITFCCLKSKRTLFEKVALKITCWIKSRNSVQRERSARERERDSWINSRNSVKRERERERESCRNFVMQLCAAYADVCWRMLTYAEMAEDIHSDYIQKSAAYIQSRLHTEAWQNFECMSPAISAYVSIRQHTSAYVSKWTDVCWPCMSARSCLYFSPFLSGSRLRAFPIPWAQLSFECVFICLQCY